MCRFQSRKRRIISRLLISHKYYGINHNNYYTKEGIKMVVSKSYSRKNARALIKYLLDEKPHSTKLVQQRNLLVTGQNIYQLADPYHPNEPPQWDSNLVAGQFGASRSHAKNQHKKVQAFHIIASFSDEEFPPEGDQKQEAQQVATLVTGFLGQYFPDDAQDLIAIQRDGRGGKLHAHIAVNSLLTSGKCLRTNLVTQTERTYVDKQGHKQHIPGFRKEFNQYLEANFQRVTGREFHPVVPSTENKVHSAEDQIVARGGYDWHEDLKERIYQAFSDPKVHDLSGFKAACAKRGVTVTEKRRGTGQKDANGKKIYKLGYTYSFTGQDKYKSGAKKGMPKAHKMRDYRMGKDGMPLRGSLGTAFTPENIEKEIKNHEFIKKERVQRDKQRRTIEATTGLESSLTGSEDDNTEFDSSSSEVPSSISVRATTATAESHSSSRSTEYQSSRRRRHFATPPRLKYVSPDFLDPDPDAERKRKQRLEERKRRNEAFKRRAKAIAEHDRRLARETERRRFKHLDGVIQTWYSLIHGGLLQDIAKLLGINANHKRSKAVESERRQSERLPESNRGPARKDLGPDDDSPDF